VSSLPCAILVVAKAPVPGLAKTRLAPTFGSSGAAELAAAALLDTLIAVLDVDASSRVVALTGDLGSARRRDEISLLLDQFVVIPQRGTGLGERLVAAHADASAVAGAPVLQIGMDTPQVTCPLLSAAAELLVGGPSDAVLGPAADGGWWALGVTDPRWVVLLEQVPMSRPETGFLTRQALMGLGVDVTELCQLTDVDVAQDVWSVAAGMASTSHFRVAANRFRPDPGRDHGGVAT
jgi:glycosyltransferase A (GT-A) superfamily protein (DUF2064 family)